MLPLQRLGGAAAGLLIVIECRIDNFREEFRNSAKPMSPMFIGPVERLSENELPRVGIVANIEPIADAAPCGADSLMYICSGGAAVHAPDDEVEIVLQIVSRSQMLWDGLPVESPEQVQAVDQDNRFE